MSQTTSEAIAGADAVFEHLNGNHADTVLYLARSVLGGDLTDAELTAADTGGVELQVAGPDGRRTERIAFVDAVADVPGLHAALLGRLAEARAADPDGELTSIEREMAEQAEIPTRTVEVVAVAEVAPGLRQVTFGGMRGHVAKGPEDFFLVILPAPGTEHLLDEDADFSRYRTLPAEEAPAWAYYTARRVRPEEGELDAWFVLHEHDGPVSGWARTVEPGARCALWGPRAAYEPPPGTEHVLLVGDETGLGAFAAILDASDGGVPVTVVAESDDGRPVVDLPARPKDTVHWVSRNGVERGTGSALLEAVRDLTIDVAGLYAYGAAESRAITAVRKHLRHDRGIPGPQVQMVGYWRRTP